MIVIGFDPTLIKEKTISLCQFLILLAVIDIIVLKKNILSIDPDFNPQPFNTYANNHQRILNNKKIHLICKRFILFFEILCDFDLKIKLHNI